MTTIGGYVMSPRKFLKWLPKYMEATYSAASSRRTLSLGTCSPAGNTVDMRCYNYNPSHACIYPGREMCSITVSQGLVLEVLMYPIADLFCTCNYTL